MAGSKSILTEILAPKLPPEERQKFIAWSNDVSNEEYDEGLALFFQIDELQEAVGDYAIEQLQELEMHCNIKITATIDVHGSVYRYRL
ncbi:hypothetical protein GMSM_25760 [Geomonas sp. Red276]